jgi:hypothetical protein
MLLVEHALQRAAKKFCARWPLADKKVGKTHEPREHGNEPGANRIVEFLCLHSAVPAAWVRAGRSGIPRESKR